MILFSIDESPDLSVEGRHTTYREGLFLGRNRGDFLIEDQGLKSPHLLIFVGPQGLFAKNWHDVDHFFCNGKKVRGTKALYQGDVLTLGQTRIKVANYLYEPSVSRSDVIRQNLEELTKKDSPLLDVFRIINMVGQRDQR